MSGVLASLLAAVACCGCIGASTRPAARPQVAAASPVVPASPALAPAQPLRTTATSSAPATTPAPTVETPPTATPPGTITSIFGRDAVLDNVLGCLDNDQAPAPPSPAGPPAPCKQRILPPDFDPSANVDKEIVRRVIRPHFNEMLACYEAAFRGRRMLGGNVMVRFIVGTSGQVIASELESSTMNETGLENCVVQTVRRLKFPKPIGGGIVVISYPFVLTPPPDEK